MISFKDYIPYIIGFIFVCAVAYGAWHIKRWWNYSWSYETQVQGTVEDMVKPECLKQ